MNSSDSNIVELIKSGDQAAFVDFLRKYQAAVRGYAYYLTHDGYAAEEVAQEVFAAVYFGIHRLREAHNVRSWLRSITYNKSMDWLSQHHNNVPLTDSLPADQPSGLDILESKEIHKLLNSTIQTLPELERIVMTLRVEGLKNFQIADFLELSQNVVDNRVYRAQKRLQEHILNILEKDISKRDSDSAEAMFRRIQTYHPLIRVALHWLTDHKPAPYCNCVSRIKFLSEQTDGVCRLLPGRGAIVHYGFKRIREDDASRAMKIALELQKQSCPAGPFLLSVRQLMSNIADSADDKMLRNTYSKIARHWKETPYIIVDNSIMWLLRDDFNFEEIQMPGLSHRVHILIHDSPSDTSAADFLVGRQAEMAQLEDTAQYLLVGGSGIVWLTGKAGIGKTHLLRNLKRRLEGRSLIWLEGKANQGEPHQPIRDAIQSYFKFLSAEELQEHLKALDLKDALPYFAELLKLPSESIDRKFNAMTVEQIHYHIFQCLRDWLLRLSADTPVAWVVEDAHWLDEESSRMLQYLARVVKQAPVLFLLSRRSGYEQIPEAQYGLELERQMAQRYPKSYKQINLGPLSKAVSHVLLSRFLGSRKLLPSQSERILKYAVGNPMYLREMAQFLVESTLTYEIPPRIERLILAHVHLLPVNYQALLQYSSLLGSRVPVSMLQIAFPMLEVAEILDQRKQVDWFLAGSSDMYEWQHDLYRETIYNSIEPETRRHLHGEIARHLESLSDTQSDVLAEHYEAAGIGEKAAYYAYQSMKTYKEQLRYGRVIHYARIALSHPESLSREQIYEASQLCAYSLKQVGNTADILPYWEQALQHASTERERIQASLGIADSCGSKQRATVIREQILASIDEFTDPGLVIEIFMDFAGRQSFQRMDSVMRVLRVIRRRGHGEAEVRILQCLATMQYVAGSLQRAQSTIQRGIRIADSLGDDKLSGDVRGTAAYIISRGPEPLTAIDHIHGARHFYEKAGINVSGLWLSIAAIYRRAEQYAAMIEHYEKVMEKLEQEETLRDTWEESINTLAHLVQGYAHQENWERAYHYFWRMIDSMGNPSRRSFQAGTEAVAFLCHQDKTDYRWAYEDVPGTMERAQVLIGHLNDHGITPEDMERLNLLHAILAAAYVEWGIGNSRKDAIRMVRLFARQVMTLDNHVEYWSYLCRSVDREMLEAALQEAWDRAVKSEYVVPGDSVDEKLFAEANPEHHVLEWLLACLRESHEDKCPGRHLLQLGLVPETFWRIAGVFKEDVPTETGQRILQSVFSEKADDAEITWLIPDDPMDGYVDCRHIFQTVDRVSSYAKLEILSPAEQRVSLSLYHDDAACVWLNGERLFERKNVSSSVFDCIFKPGTNKLLIRVTNYREGWGFMLRILDTDGKPLRNLTFA